MRMRSVVLKDAAAVLELVVARDIADLGAPGYTLADLESDWGSSAVRLKHDTRVIQDGEAIVGYATMRPNEAHVIVHPDAGAHVATASFMADPAAARRDRRL